MDGQVARGYRAGMGFRTVFWLGVVAVYGVIVAAIALNNADPGAAAGITLGLTAAVVGGTFAYFAPTLIARHRGVRNVAQVAIVNTLFGWSVIGWVIALVMAFAPVQRLA